MGIINLSRGLNTVGGVGGARVRGHGIINSKERLDDGIITLESKVRSPQDAIAHGTGEFVTHKA
jgi:hypothetical protein